MTKNSLDITGNDLNRKIGLILFLNLACRPEQDPDNLPVRALELEPTQHHTEGPSPDQAAGHLAQDSHHQPGPGHHQENRQLARARTNFISEKVFIMLTGLHLVIYVELRHKHHVTLHLVHDHYNTGLPSHNHTPHTAL